MCSTRSTSIAMVYEPKFLSIAPAFSRSRAKRAAESSLGIQSTTAHGETIEKPRSSSSHRLQAQRGATGIPKHWRELAHLRGDAEPPRYAP